MIAVVMIKDGEVQWAEYTSDGAIDSREDRIRCGISTAKKFLDGIRIGAELAGLFVSGDTQYNTWLEIKSQGIVFRVRETLPDSSIRWLDGRP